MKGPASIRTARNRDATDAPVMLLNGHRDKEESAMIRHLVLVRFRDDADASEISAIFAQLGALRSVLPGMAAFAGGPNLSPEGLARGFTHGLSCDFVDVPARDTYLAHPAHKAAGERLLAATQGGADGIVVLDFEAR